MRASNGPSYMDESQLEQRESSSEKRYAVGGIRPVRAGSHVRVLLATSLACGAEELASIRFNPVTSFGVPSEVSVVSLDREDGLRSYLAKCQGPTCSGLPPGGYRYVIEPKPNGRKIQGRVYLGAGNTWLTVNLGVSVSEAADYESSSLSGQIKGPFSRNKRNWVRVQEEKCSHARLGSRIVLLRSESARILRGRRRAPVRHA
jgi:hypothetical protein